MANIEIVEGPPLVAVRDLSEYLAARGIKAGPKTCRRWTTVGVRGVKLSARKYGASAYVSAADINEFFDRLNASSTA